MTEETKKIENAVEELKNANEETLKSTIEKWYESTRTDGMKIGARYISAAIYGAINKNLKKGPQSSLRDYQRAIKRIREIVSVQLETQQNDSEEMSEEITNDGTAE